MPYLEASIRVSRKLRVFILGSSPFLHDLCHLIWAEAARAALRRRPEKAQRPQPQQPCHLCPVSLQGSEVQVGKGGRRPYSAPPPLKETSQGRRREPHRLDELPATLSSNGQRIGVGEFPRLRPASSCHFAAARERLSRYFPD